MPLLPDCLLGAKHVHAHVRTEADYRARHLEAMRRAVAMYPNLDCRLPWRPETQPAVFVAGGFWQVRCVTPGCGNYPAVQPEWGLALCWDCGAVYDGLQVPDATDIERVLMRRPMVHRNWIQPETVADLERENRAHGLEAA